MQSDDVFVPVHDASGWQELSEAQRQEIGISLLALHEELRYVSSEPELGQRICKNLADRFHPVAVFCGISDPDVPSRYCLYGNSELNTEDHQRLVTFLESVLPEHLDRSMEILDSLPLLRNCRKYVAATNAGTTHGVFLFLLEPRKITGTGIGVLISVVSECAGLRLENLRSRETIQRHLTSLKGLHQSARGISRLLFKIDELLQNICEEARRTLLADAAAVLIPTDETKTAYRVRAQTGFPEDKVKLRKDLFAQAFEDFKWNGQKGVVYRTPKGQTFFLLPVIQRGEANGILLFLSEDPVYRVSEDRIQVAEIFADWVSIATESVKMFQRVYEKEKEWENTFDSIADPIYIIDDDFRLKKINKSMAAFAMKDIKLPLDRNCYRYLFDQSGVCPWCPVPKSVQSREPVTVEAAIYHGGTWQIQSFPYTDKSGERIGSINVLRDVTLLKRMQEQLIESEKLASAGKLISGVAHEVRNPLFGISTTVRALANELGNKQDIKPFLEIITSETTRLNRLMEDLLNYSRPVQIDKNPSDMTEIVQEVIEHFHHVPSAQGVSIELVNSDRIPPLNVDRNKIKQVLFNLVENGIQHAGPQPHIGIFLQYLSFANPPEIQIVIKDNGSGISEQDLPRVFDPFFTTRKRGTGLGLSIVRKVIHDHGGRISIESHTGIGTTFRITLPVPVVT